MFGIGRALKRGEKKFSRRIAGFLGIDDEYILSVNHNVSPLLSLGGERKRIMNPISRFRVVKKATGTSISSQIKGDIVNGNVHHLRSIAKLPNKKKSNQLQNNIRLKVPQFADTPLNLHVGLSSNNCEFLFRRDDIDYVAPPSPVDPLYDPEFDDDNEDAIILKELLDTATFDPLMFYIVYYIPHTRSVSYVAVPISDSTSALGVWNADGADESALDAIITLGDVTTVGQAMPKVPLKIQGRVLRDQPEGTAEHHIYKTSYKAAFRNTRTYNEFIDSSVVVGDPPKRSEFKNDEEYNDALEDHTERVDAEPDSGDMFVSTSCNALRSTKGGKATLAAILKNYLDNYGTGGYGTQDSSGTYTQIPVPARFRGSRPGLAIRSFETSVIVTEQVMTATAATVVDDDDLVRVSPNGTPIGNEANAVEYKLRSSVKVSYEQYVSEGVFIDPNTKRPLGLGKTCLFYVIYNPTTEEEEVHTSFKDMDELRSLNYPSPATMPIYPDDPAYDDYGGDGVNPVQIQVDDNLPTTFKIRVVEGTSQGHFVRDIYDIESSHLATKDGQSKYSVSSLQNEVFTDTDLHKGGVNLPIPQDVIDELPFSVKHNLVAESLHLVTIYTHITFVPYYKTAKFFKVLRIVVTIIMIIVMIISVITTAGTTTAAVVAFFEAVLLALVVSYVVSLAIKFILKHVDNRFLQFVLILIVLIIGILAGDSSGFQLAFDVILQVVNAVTIVMGNYVTESAIAEAAAMKEEATKYADYMRNLASMQKELDSSESSELIKLMLRYRHAETAEEFEYRTTHADTTQMGMEVAFTPLDLDSKLIM